MDENLRVRLAETLGLPYDTVLGYPMLQLAGNRKIRVENHTGVRRLAADGIWLGTPKGVVRLLGSELYLARLDKDEAVVAGRLEQIDLSGLR